MEEPVYRREPQSAQQVLRACEETLARSLPSSWKLERPSQRESTSSDAVYRLTSPRGEAIELVAELRSTVERRDITRIQQQLGKLIARLGAGKRGIIFAKYLSQPVRDELATTDLGYVDAAGNMRLQIDRLGVFISIKETGTNPWRRVGRPPSDLKGEPAARVVRALLDNSGPLTISSILKLSGASTAPTYRVRDYLMQEELLERDDSDNTYRVPDWRKLLRQWATDYEIAQLNIASTYIAPRGIDWMCARAAEVKEFRYAVTGSVAANYWAPYAPAKAAMIYVEDSQQAAEWLDLRATDAGQNVVLLEPKATSSVVFERTREMLDGVVLASPSQVAVDLLTGPGRNPAEGEALIEWMTNNESEWRQ